MSVNREHVLELHDFIRDHEEYDFNMRRVNMASCGTAACIAGFAVALWPDVRYENTTSWDIELLAAKLGISSSQADDLVYPWVMNEYFIPRSAALLVLQRLADTGEVIWKEADLFDHRGNRFNIDVE